MAEIVARRGRPRLEFDPSEWIKILELLRDGNGRKRACLEVGIGYSRLVRLVRDDPGFAECVRVAEEIGGEARKRRASSRPRRDARREAAEIVVARPRRGRPRKNFDPCEGIKILELLRAGYGRKMVCLQVGISYTRFLRVVRADPEFAECVRMAEGMRDEACEYQIYQMAIGITDTPVRLRAAVAYLGRRERMAAVRRGREKARGV